MPNILKHGHTRIETPANKTYYSRQRIKPLHPVNEQVHQAYTNDQATEPNSVNSNHRSEP